ncbi:MAG: restriction endonuclease [Stenotrophobium sp.]
MTSPIEKIYKEIFGSLPSKSGAAFERLAAIAMALLEEGNVTHDSRLRGQFSKTLYQLDVHHQSTDGQISKMGEAKDYSERGSKVGRGDVQKLAGALPDLQPIDAAAFFSATGYTSPAKKYAENATSITGGKPITLYELATSTEQDEQGFIKTIVINLHLEIPHPHRGTFIPILTEQGQHVLKDRFLRDGAAQFQYQMGLSEFFDANGNSILSLGKLTASGYGCIHDDDKSAHGCYWLPRHHINISGVLAEIHGLEFTVPYSFMEREVRITDDSTHRFVVRDKNGTPLRILTDEKIRTFTFDEDGQLTKR